MKEEIQTEKEDYLENNSKLFGNIKNEGTRPASVLFFPTLCNALCSLHPWPQSRFLCSLPLPWLLHWISQQLWKLSPSVTPPHLYAIGLVCPFPSYLPSKLLFTHEDSELWSLPLWCLTESSTPSPCAQRSWHRPLEKTVSRKRAWVRSQPLPRLTVSTPCH